ncbi:MAG: hypothetical protein AB7F86_18455 [Bdellovibrionales bacterium]
MQNRIFSSIQVFLFALVLLSHNLHAAEADPKAAQEPSTLDKVEDATEQALEAGKEKVNQFGQALSEMRQRREERQWLITGNYSYLDLWIPSKYGVSVAYVKSAEDTYELDYMRASYGLGWFGVDLGEVTEQRLALLYRSFSKRNSFNFQMGVNYNKFAIHIGNDLLAKVSGNSNLDYSLMQIETLGLSWGLGNRWQTKGGFVWSFDWLQLHIPLLKLTEKTPFIDATTDSSDRDDAKTAVKLIRYFPRIVALKVQLGFTF